MPDRPRDRRTWHRHAPAAPVLPDGPFPIATGTAELRRDRHAPAVVTVVVNGVPSSALDLEHPDRLEFEYMQQMAAAVELLAPGPLDAVHLGAAGCAFPCWLEATRPGSRQVAVDLDARLLDAVRRWLPLPRAPRLRLRTADARAALEAMPDASVDLVVRDVFAGDRTPGHVTTVEFVEHAARVLRPGGLYLANCADRPPLATARAEVSTARAVMAQVALVADPGQLKGRRYGNLVLLAAPGPAPDLTAAALERRLRSLPQPVRLLHGAELDTFAARTEPLRDADDGLGRRSDAPA